MATSRSAALNYLWLQIRTAQTKRGNNILHETLEISEYVVRHTVLNVKSMRPWVLVKNVTTLIYI